MRVGDPNRVKVRQARYPAPEAANRTAHRHQGARAYAQLQGGRRTENARQPRRPAPSQQKLRMTFHRTVGDFVPSTSCGNRKSCNPHPSDTKVQTMRFLRKYAFWLLLFCLVTAWLVLRPRTRPERDWPMDSINPSENPMPPDIILRAAFGPRYHMGEDWNGLKGATKIWANPFTRRPMALLCSRAICEWVGETWSSSAIFFWRTNK